MYTSGASKSVPQGFTLIELLVVIAIIGLLATMLIPSLVSVQEQGYRVVCRTNHRGLMTALHMYTTEGVGRMPFVNSNKMEKGNTNNGDAFEMPGWLYQYHSDDPGKEEIELEEGLLWMYIGEKRGYRCPADKSPYNMGPIHKISSYLMNRAYNGGGKSVWPAYKAHRFKPDAVVFWEVNEYKSGGYWNDGTNTPGQGITRRHGSGATLSTVGGEAVWVSFAEYEQMLETRPGPLYCVPDEPDGW
ncbi:MAG: type II secretion system protein [Phycisphaerae bacterium]